jgi:hypothetical protein
MARRILSADSALAPPTQASLGGAGRGDSRGAFFQWLHERWSALLGLSPHEVLFDWNDRTALMSEIEFVNQARERLDEAALRLAPSMLRIVLTVKANLPDAGEQRAFLAEHVDWDLRRISELCIAADSYGLLDPAQREAGSREIARYGWSCALKLAYVRDPDERREVWDRARGMHAHASYRAVLEEIRRLRERKLIGPPASSGEVALRVDTVRERLGALEGSLRHLVRPEQIGAALEQVAQTQHELGRLKRALQERLQAAETEALAESA